MTLPQESAEITGISHHAQLAAIFSLSFPSPFNNFSSLSTSRTLFSPLQSQRGREAKQPTQTIFHDFCLLQVEGKDHTLKWYKRKSNGETIATTRELSD